MLLVIWLRNPLKYQWNARLTASSPKKAPAGAQVRTEQERIRYGHAALGRRISRARQQGNHARETQWVPDTARPCSEIALERTRNNGGAWKETRYIRTPNGVKLQISESEQGHAGHIRRMHKTIH